MAPFEQREYESQQFDHLQMPSGEFDDKVFDNCTFVDCVLSGAQFNHCRFYECTFMRCDLSNARMPACSFINTRFEHTKLIGMNWTEIDWEGLSPRKVGFDMCNISYSIFAHLDLPRIHMTNCVAHDVEFAEANLTGADCRGTDFTETLFHHTNLTEVDFTGARNYSISPALNILLRARFSLPEAVSLLNYLDIVLVQE